MTAMPRVNMAKRAALAGAFGAGWLLLAAGAWLYAVKTGIPGWVALPVAAAFLIEIPFYLAPAYRFTRDWLAARGKVPAACWMMASSLLPWAVYSAATGKAGVTQLLLLLAVALAVSFWYLALPVAPVTDVLFLVLIAGLYLAKIFDRIYLSPAPQVTTSTISTLGHLMLIRTAALAVLIIRGNARAEYRFIPTRSEFLTGLRYFVVMLPLIATTYWALGLVELRALPKNPGLTLLLAIGTFVAILAVVAFSEEFFFRGLLQQWIGRWTKSPNVALIVTSVIFGCAHLGFHKKFPNWQWAIVAGILGIFCGLAWRNARSVQASMVTHALIVTVWRVFLR